MNLILLFDDDFVDEARTRVRLEGRRCRHVRKVLRAEPGDRLTVGLLGGTVGDGLVRSLDRTCVELEVDLREDPPEPLDVVVVLALPRPPVLRRSLAAITSLGVKRIALVDTERVEKSFWQSHAIDADVLFEQVVLGLEQARDTHRPEVTLHPRFGPFVEEVLPALASGRAAWVGHPEGAAASEVEWATPALLAIGPEGGWVPGEVDALGRCGLRPVALGERILRVETAVSVLLGRHL